MAGHRPFEELRKKMSPERRRRSELEARKELEQMLLSELRMLLDMTQADLADELGVSQSHVSQMENAEDMRVSTLMRLVEALGGKLEIVVELPGGRVSITPQFKPPA